MRTHKAGSKVCSEASAATIVFDLRPGQNAGKLRFIVRTFVPTTSFFCFVIFIFLCPSQGFFVFCFIFFIFLCSPQGFLVIVLYFLYFCANHKFFFKFYSIYILCPPQCFLFCFSLLIFSFSFVVSIKTFCQIATWTLMLLSIFLF